MTATTTRPLTVWQAAWRLVRFRPWLYLAAFLTSLAYESVPIASGIILKALFDGLTGAAPVGLNAPTLIALLVAAEGARIGALLLGYWTWSTSTYTFSALPRRNLLDWLFRGPGSRALPGSSGELISRFRDDVEELYNYLEGWIDLGPTVIRTVIALAIMLAIDPLVTTVVFLPLVAIVAATNALGGRITTYRQASRAAAGRVAGFLGEIFGAVQTIKAGAAEGRVAAHFDRLSEGRRRVAQRDSLLTGLLGSFNGNVVALGTALTLLLVGRSLRAGSFTVGDLALFVTYLAWATELPYWVGEMIARHKQTGVSLARLDATLAGAPAGTLMAPASVHLDGTVPPVPATVKRAADRLSRLDVSGVTARHPDSGGGIAGIDLHLERGTVTVITGRVGAGKTTLLRALLGLIPREGGEIRWNGRVVADPAAFLVPPRAAYTPQAPRLFSESLRDNILLGQDDCGLRIADCGLTSSRACYALRAAGAAILGPRSEEDEGRWMRQAASRTRAMSPTRSGPSWRRT